MIFMETIAIIAVRYAVQVMFAIDLFDFNSKYGRWFAIGIAVAVFAGVYKLFTSMENIENVADAVVHGTPMSS